MKSRFILPLVALGVISMFSVNSAQAGLFGHGCGADSYCCSAEPSCGVSSCDPCGSRCRPGLFAHLRAHLAAKRCHASSCCEPVCGSPEPTCGIEPGCGIADPGCGIADPGCGIADAGCGCADSCGHSHGCRPRCGLFSHLRAKWAARRACCSPCAAEVSCGVAVEPACGCH